MTLLAISIDPPVETNTSLSPALEERLPELVETILAEVREGSADAGKELARRNVDDPQAADSGLAGDAAGG